MEGKLTSARTLDVVYEAVHAAARPSVSSLVLRVLIAVRVMLANAALGLLRLALFRWSGYRTTEFRRIVVYTAGILGDNAVMLPAIAALRRRYPAATLTIITNSQGSAAQSAIELWCQAGIADSFYFVDDALVRHRGIKFWLDTKQLTWAACDLFVNLSPFGNRGWFGAVVREMFLAKLLGATHAVGFHVSTWRVDTLGQRVQQYFIQNEPRRAVTMLRTLGLKPASGDLLPHDPGAWQSVLRKVGLDPQSHRMLAVIHPGAKFAVQRWPAERFGAVAARLASSYQAVVAVTGTPVESATVQTTVAASGGEAVGLAGNTTLPELIELLRHAAILVTNDTGTMHLAALLGTPTVAIFGTRQTPTHWFPAHTRVIALFKMLECSYCHKDRDDCDHLSCLRDITIDDVCNAVTQLIGTNARVGPTATPSCVTTNVARTRFSIVLPVRNGEPFLTEALASAVAQTRPADEILVVDDGSDDRSAQIAQSDRWAGRVRYEYNAHSTGFAEAWNRAAAMACGDYVAILHQDDLLAPDYLLHIEQALQRYPQVQHLYAACRYIDSQGATIQAPPLPHSLEPVLYSGQDYAHRYCQGVMANQHIHRCPGVTTSRQLLLAGCAYRQEAGHIADDDFFYRVGAFTDVVGISQPLASYREHAGSITGQLKSASLRLAQDYVYQLRKNRDGSTLLGQEDLAGMQRLAVKLINDLLCYGLRQHNGDWLRQAMRLRQDLESLTPGAMAAALPAWARPLWRLAEGSGKRRLACGYIGLLDSGLRLRHLSQAPAKKG